MTDRNHCAVCTLRIRRAEEGDRPWLHDDPAYDPFKPPIHAPRPADGEGPAPEPYKGWPEHRYIYSSEDGDSCSCGWSPTHFRMTDQAEWDQHVEEAESA